MHFERLLSRKRAILGTFHLTSGKSRCASGPLPIARRSTLALGDGVHLFRHRCIQTKVSLSTMPRRSMVGVTHLPAIHRAGQLGLQIAVSGPPPLDATELKPSSVTNCLTAIPVGFTPCSMNCSKRLHDDTLGKHFRKMSPERVDLGTNRRKIQEGGYSLGLTPHLLAPGSPSRNQSRSGA